MKVLKRQMEYKHFYIITLLLLMIPIWTVESLDMMPQEVDENLVVGAGNSISGSLPTGPLLEEATPIPIDCPTIEPIQYKGVSIEFAAPEDVRFQVWELAEDPQLYEEFPPEIYQGIIISTIESLPHVFSDTFEGTTIRYWPQSFTFDKFLDNFNVLTYTVRGQANFDDDPPSIYIFAPPEETMAIFSMVSHELAHIIYRKFLSEEQRSEWESLYEDSDIENNYDYSASFYNNYIGYSDEERVEERFTFTFQDIFMDSLGEIADAKDRLSANLSTNYMETVKFIFDLFRHGENGELTYIYRIENDIIKRAEVGFSEDGLPDINSEIHWEIVEQ
ncbi:MAG: hypothetical protein P9M06_02950 [Candidatus Saelkia tenebricola]|nr:hypothetical protein [Candidatus Saelkia tenebricola]